MRSPFTGLYSGSGRGCRDGVRQQLHGSALCQIDAGGRFDGWLADSAAGDQRRWQGEAKPNGFVLLWAAAAGPHPHIACGSIWSDRDGTLVLDLAAAGLGMTPEQWRFTLGPQNGYGVAGT